MDCQGCGLGEFLIQIKAEGENNEEMLPTLENLMRIRNALYQADEGMLTIKEFGARELLDFCNDHMDQTNLWFRFQEGEWQPFSELIFFLDTKWIDKMIANSSIHIYFQPIVDAGERIYAYEALARFVGEDGSMLYPNEVFSAAKTRGRLYALDRLCRLKAVEAAAPLRVKIFINFIPTSIYSPEFCLKSTVELANRLGGDPTLFVFEVVETEKTEDLGHLKRILAFYKEKGFQYALDDVGQGYSTLEVLTELTPHYMKLDRTYVHGVAGCLEKQRTAELLLRSALLVGAAPLAEGIESREDFEWLRQRGYELFQGYLFGKPSPDPLKLLDVQSCEFNSTKWSQ